MNGKYLGEFDVDITTDKNYANYKKEDWMFYFIDMYGCIDGAHHKDWTMDQVARIYHDSPVRIKMEKWDCGTENYRISVGEPSERYLKYVEDYEAEGYEYEAGSPP